MSIPTPPCPCCSASNPTLLGRLPDSLWFAGTRLAQPLHGGWLYGCTQCRLKFRYPIEKAITYLELYDNAKTTTWPAETKRLDWDLIIKQIGALKPQGGRVLDFGCYSGGLLSRLDARYERFGVEVNRDAARTAQETSNARVWFTSAEIPTDLQFDIIVIADVIEHVPDPRGMVDLLATKLAEDGIMIVTTGDADDPLWNCFGANWWYCFYPEHIAFVSHAWVESALCPRGWSIVHYEHFRYHHFGRGRRLLELTLTYAYGWFPRAYLYIGNVLKGCFKHGALTSVPGSGVGADHILFVVNRKRQP